MKRLVFLAALAGCATTAPDGGLQLTGEPAAVFRRITGHEGITLSDKVVIYGTEQPANAYVMCHEGEHRKQARVLGDALVGLGAIDDDDVSRAAAWLALYGIDYAQYGYDNRWERGANAACADVP